MDLSHDDSEASVVGGCGLLSPLGLGSSLGLGLPPVPPSSSPPPAQVPNEPFKTECSNFVQPGVEVYFDIHTNQCVSADMPQSNGKCVTGYVKNVDGSLCEPENFHCPAGSHVEGYSDQRPNADCVNNDRTLPRITINHPLFCAPGWHFKSHPVTNPESLYGCERD